MMYRNTQNGRFISKGNLFEDDGENVYCYNADHELLFFTELKNAGLVKNKTWSKCANGYSSTRINGKFITAHRFLIGAKDGELVDHINGNKKDDRCSNLRLCNKSQNAYNSKIRYDNKSGYTGVRCRNDTHKWQAEIKHNYQKIVLGSFASKEEAITARRQAEIEYAGEFRRAVI